MTGKSQNGCHEFPEYLSLSPFLAMGQGRYGEPGKSTRNKPLVFGLRLFRAARLSFRVALPDGVDQARLDLSDGNARRAGCDDVMWKLHLLLEMNFVHVALSVFSP